MKGGTPTSGRLSRRGRLRTTTGRAGTISAVDAVVVALAATRVDPLVLTGDPLDVRALAEHAATRITTAVV